MGRSAGDDGGAMDQQAVLGETNRRGYGKT
jgi:hypothetical protein